MGGDIFAFAYGLDRYVMLKHGLERLYTRKILLHVLTDSKQVVDTITKEYTTTDRQILIDIAAARHEYNCQEISNIGSVLSEEMIADELTNTTSGVSLKNLLSNGRNELKVKQ